MYTSWMNMDVPLYLDMYYVGVLCSTDDKHYKHFIIPAKNAGAAADRYCFSIGFSLYHNVKTRVLY